MDVNIADAENALVTIAILVGGYLLFGLVLWLRFPQPKNQKFMAFVKGVILLPLMFLLSYLLRRGRVR